MEFLLLDASFGFFDLLLNPLAAIFVIGLAALLIYRGVKAIRRELAKKKGLPPEGPMIESESPETEPLPETETPAELSREGEEKPPVPEADQTDHE